LFFSELRQISINFAKFLQPICHLSAKNHENWWKFDGSSDTNLNSFFETRCRY